MGYGHSKRPEWDINAFLAAQKEKDKQIESVLYKILQELKKLYANHAPQLKPRGQQRTSSDNSEGIDPVEDMYNILEGSALIPFIEVSVCRWEGDWGVKKRNVQFDAADMMLMDHPT